MITRLTAINSINKRSDGLLRQYRLRQPSSLQSVTEFYSVKKSNTFALRLTPLKTITIYSSMPGRA